MFTQPWEEVMFGTPIPTRLVGGLLFAAALTSLAFTAAAQSPPARPANRKAPPPPPPAVKDQQQFLSYWTTETGWHTELQLRNNQMGHTVTVTPVLRTP